MEELVAWSSCGIDSSSFSDSSVGISCFASALQIYLPHLAQTKACLECSRTGQRSLHGSFLAEVVVKEDSKLLQSNS